MAKIHQHEPSRLTMLRTSTDGEGTTPNRYVRWLLKQYDDQSEDNANLAKQLQEARNAIHEYEAAQPPTDEDRLRSLNIAR